MAAPTYPISGIPVPSGSPIPMRQEIDAWSQNPDNAIQVSLFVQALTRFQKISFKDQLSYYQVAGIHGFPVVPWDGVPGGFYCSHNRITFPTWHRPYMLLYEQRIYETMLEVISDTVPPADQELWRLSAASWRLPYWDWAAKQPYIQNYGVPHIFTQETIDIVLPLGAKSESAVAGEPSKGAPIGGPLASTTVENPLWKFTNPAGPTVPMGDKTIMGEYAIDASSDGPPESPVYPWDKCIATSRYGLLGNDPAKWASGINNWEDCNAAMQNPQWYEGNPGSIAEAVYRLFTDEYFKSWETFSSTKYHSVTVGSEYLSLEYIHNNIHNFTGGIEMVQLGAGHMSDVPVAAFDPIFWLHHCNIDRQLALFQLLNPTKWFDNSLADDDTPTTPLTPFHTDTQASLYDSNATRDWRTLGYDYDTTSGILNDDGRLDGQNGRAELKRRLNQLYSTTRGDMLGAPKLGGDENDYIINVVYDRYALQGRPYTIHFFLGAPSGDLAPLSQHLNHIGSIYTFSNAAELRAASHCPNCIAQRTSGVLSKAQIHITSVLLAHALDERRDGISSLVPAEVSALWMSAPSCRVRRFLL
jgi:tyrosinase